MQWHERLSEFLDIDFIEDNVPKKRGRKKVFSPVGSLDSTSNTLHGVVDVALMQSCFEDGEVKSFVDVYKRQALIRSRRTDAGSSFGS